MKCSLSPMVPPNEAQLGLNLLVSLNVVEGRRVKEDLHQPKSRLRKLLFALQHYVRKIRLIQPYSISVLLRCSCSSMYLTSRLHTRPQTVRRHNDQVAEVLSGVSSSRSTFAPGIYAVWPYSWYSPEHPATQNFGSVLELEQVIARSTSLLSF